MQRTLIIMLLLAATTALGQEKKKEEPLEPIQVVTLDRKDPIVFEKDIDPILANRCTYCHSGKVVEGKFDISTFDGLMKGGKSGPAIVPGKPGASRLMQMVGHVARPVMPPKTEEPATPQELAMLKLWIEQGAKGPASAIARKRDVKLIKMPDSVTPVVALAVGPDKSLIAAGRGNQIHLYDAGSGYYLQALVNPDLKDSAGSPVRGAHLDIVQALTFSPDGRYLVSSGYQEVIIWDVQTGLLRRRITGFADRVVALDVSADGRWLATGGGTPTADGEIRTYDLASGELVLDIKSGHSDTVFGVRFSPDVTKLATCSADKFVKTWDLPSGKFLKSFEGHTHHVMDVGWAPGSKTLASCGADNVVKVWDFDRGEQVGTIANAHTKQVTRMVFIGNKPEIATCSGDGTVKFFNVNGRNNLRNFGGNNDFLYAVGVSPDGALMATGGQESVVRVYNGTNAQLLKTLQPPDAGGNK